MGLFKSSEEKEALKQKYAEEDDEEDVPVQLTDKPFTRNDILVCATHGYIYAIHKSNGMNIWTAKFPKGAMGNVVSLFVTDEDKLIVGSRGRTAGMNLLNGQTLWLNKMPSFGMGEVAVITTPSKYLSPSKHPQVGETEVPPHYNEEVIPEEPIVLACSRGKAMGIDVNSGETLWTYDCPGGRYKIPTALVEPPSAEEGRPDGLVYIGAGKWIYCLKARTGEVVWKENICDRFWGYGYMTMATPWSSRLAAEAYTAFSQNPTAYARDVERQQERSQ